MDCVVSGLCNRLNGQEDRKVDWTSAYDGFGSRRPMQKETRDP